MKNKLTDDDRELIARLKAERDRLRREARQLRDVDIAKKFNVSRTTVERIPAWNT